MKSKAFTPLLIVPLLVACTDPFVVIPGGRLDGPVSPVPDDWGVVPEVVQFEVRPENPYSVNIWALEDQGNLYVATRNAKWVAFIEADRRVRMRIENNIYELVASRVSETAELERVTEAYIRKYNIDGTESFVDDGQLFRLTSR